jgi:anti-anti-sigma factor
MTARAMPGVSAEKSARAGCVVVALRGELDVCTAADGLSALTAPAGARVVVDLTGLAFMDCYSLNGIMTVRARARSAGGDLVRHACMLTGLITAASRKRHGGQALRACPGNERSRKS